MRCGLLVISVLFLLICGHAASGRRGSYLRQTLEAMRAQLNEANVSLINDTLRVLFPRNLMFDPGQAAVRADFLPTLERFSRVLQQYSRTEILLVGHTDSHGNEQRNIELSRYRADSTRMQLQRMGVNSSRLSSWGIGSGLPAASNQTEKGRARNRRVEFIVLYNYPTDTEIQ